VLLIYDRGRESLVFEYSATANCCSNRRFDKFDAIKVSESGATWSQPHLHNNSTLLIPNDIIVVIIVLIARESGRFSPGQCFFNFLLLPLFIYSYYSELVFSVPPFTVQTIACSNKATFLVNSIKIKLINYLFKLILKLSTLV